MACVDLLVHRKALMGSPAVVSSRISSSTFRTLSSMSSTLFRPAPGCRIIPSSGFNNFLPDFSSSTAFVIVVRDIPVNSHRRLIPPRPKSNALSATYSRAWNSFNVLSTFSHRRSSKLALTFCLDLIIHLKLLPDQRFVQLIIPAPLRVLGLHLYWLNTREFLDFFSAQSTAANGGLGKVAAVMANGLKTYSNNSAIMQQRFGYSPVV